MDIGRVWWWYSWLDLHGNRFARNLEGNGKFSSLTNTPLEGGSFHLSFLAPGATNSFFGRESYCDCDAALMIRRAASVL